MLLEFVLFFTAFEEEEEEDIMLVQQIFYFGDFCRRHQHNFKFSAKPKLFSFSSFFMIISICRLLLCGERYIHSSTSTTFQNCFSWFRSFSITYFCKHSLACLFNDLLNHFTSNHINNNCSQQRIRMMEHFIVIMLNVHF